MCAGGRFLGCAMEYLPGMLGDKDKPFNEGGGWSLLKDWLCQHPSEVALGRVEEAARSQLKKAHETLVDFGPNCSAMEYCTAVHGDLRPCNIAVRQSAESAGVTVSFLDFGFAGLAPRTDGVPYENGGAR